MSLKANIPAEDMMKKSIAVFGYFKYLSSVTRNNARFTWEIKYNITLAKAAFNNTKHFSTSNCT